MRMRGRGGNPRFFPRAHRRSCVCVDILQGADNRENPEGDMDEILSFGGPGKLKLADALKKAKSKKKKDVKPKSSKWSSSGLSDSDDEGSASIATYAYTKLWVVCEGLGVGSKSIFLFFYHLCLCVYLLYMCCRDCAIVQLLTVWLSLFVMWSLDAGCVGRVG